MGLVPGSEGNFVCHRRDKGSTRIVSTLRSRLGPAGLVVVADPVDRANDGSGQDKQDDQGRSKVKNRLYKEGGLLVMFEKGSRLAPPGRLIGQGCNAPRYPMCSRDPVGFLISSFSSSFSLATAANFVV